ncbi:MAG: fused protease/ribonucleoside-triphosphate reductase [Candidatus Altiarchaeales archaeon]|nr:fused protease/ribonucleoside-triphosphate reductase [Candidatus Altiarchaeales archaeon]
MSLNLPWSNRKAQKSAQEMFKRMWDFKFLPPGRGLWAMGSEFIFDKGGSALNNCGFVGTAELDADFSAPFVWLMDMSMYGVGVGFDTKGAEKEVFLKKPKRTKDVHVVEDSREGWVALFQRVLDSYVGRDSLPSDIDYSQIREPGSPIKGFGGIAPGYKPLKELIDRTLRILDKYVAEEAPVDTPLIVDLMNFAGAAVVAGGIRRTAEIAFGDMQDEEFLHLKDLENLKNNDLARWASNNSVVAAVGADYTNIATQTAINGEPGYFWLENAQAYGRMIDPPNWVDYRISGCNPCSEQSLESWELCNLVESFPSRHEDLEDYKTTLKYAYMYAKTVTLLPTHDPRTNAVMLRNRRIGLSQTGIVENINRVGLREHLRWCDLGYKEVRHWDKIYSDWLCVPESIKVTSVKPSGTVSLLPGVTPGIHFPHSEYYIRRVRVGSNSPLWGIMKEAGYPVEPDKMQPDYTMIVSFPVHEDHFDRRKSEVSMWEQFELAAQIQAYWADNQVSVTITIKPEESQDLPRALSMYESRLKSVSFLPLTDHQYEQAPYEEITESEYKKLHSKLKKVRLNPVDEEDRVVDKFCDGDTCEIK